MKYALPLKLAGYAVVVLAALLAFGLLFAVATTPPAHAFASRRPDPGTEQVPAGAYDALHSEVVTFSRCAAAKPGYMDARNRNVFSQLEQADIWAARDNVNNNRADFDQQAAIARSEIARLSPTWGC